METIDINTVELHKLTETHPVMSQEQFNAFVKDIESNGQLQPVLVYRNKIVDGRHRYKALSQLGIPDIKVERLANNLTMEEVLALVMSSEIRRHQSPTQLAIKGFRLYKSSNVTQADVVVKVGCSLANLKHVIALEALGRMDIVDLLESGGKVDISRDYRYPKMSDSLLAIVTKVKEDKARVEALQCVENSDKEEKKISKTDMLQFQVTEQLIGTWSEPMLKMLIAKCYELISK